MKTVTIDHSLKITVSCLGLSEHRNWFPAVLTDILKSIFTERGYFVSHLLKNTIDSVRERVGVPLDTPYTEQEVLLAYLAYKAGEGKVELVNLLENSPEVKLLTGLMSAMEEMKSTEKPSFADFLKNRK